MTEKTYLSELPFWNVLTEREKESLSANAFLRSFAKGTEVHGRGSACLGAALVIEGSLRLYLLSDEGKEITLFRLEEGEPCILSASCILRQITFETHMIAERDCRLLVINSMAFDRLMEENLSVKCFVYQLATERFSAVVETMQRILFLTFDRRLATYLLEESEKTGMNEIHATHDEIALQISSAREVVARMLKRFESEGLVELKRGRIFLKDVDGLRKIL